MQINLKKSAALQIAIRDAVKDLDLGTTTKISIFSKDVEADVANAAEAYAEAVARRAELQDALFHIRDLTGAANAGNGIDGLLSQTARVKSDIEFLCIGVSGTARESEDVIKGKIERLSREVPASDRRYGAMAPGDEIHVSLLTQESLDEMKEQLREKRRQAQDLKDALLEKNISTRITLPERIVKVLKEARLIG